jgi:translation initiation factor 2B subunit (eIF-2B alpha/beta/delta family)
MTPFDTALRVHRREVDALKASISTEIDRITTLDTQARAHDETLRQERALAYSMPFASDAYTMRMKAERIRLAEAADHAQNRLGALRAQTVEVYGTMRAIEGAAERFQDDADRTAAVAEQGAIDDIAAAKFIAARRKGRGQ